MSENQNKSSPSHDIWEHPLVAQSVARLTADRQDTGSNLTRIKDFMLEKKNLNLIPLLTEVEEYCF